jgi:hypothetical protein
MGAKGEIGWKRLDDDGVKVKICAEPNRKDWHFFYQYRRNERWEELAEPSQEDWLNLLDSVRRRVARRLLPPDAEKNVKRLIRERFPDAEIT